MDTGLVQKLIAETTQQAADFRPSERTGDADFAECPTVDAGDSPRMHGWRCENPHVTPDGRQTPCGHCPACLRRKRHKFVRKAMEGLGEPGVYVFVTLTAPGFVRPGVPVHVAPKEGEARRRCPACGKYHEPGFSLSVLTEDFRDVDFM